LQNEGKEAFDNLESTMQKKKLELFSS